MTKKKLVIIAYAAGRFELDAKPETIVALKDPERRDLYAVSLTDNEDAFLDYAEIQSVDSKGVYKSHEVIHDSRKNNAYREMLDALKEVKERLLNVDYSVIKKGSYNAGRILSALTIVGDAIAKAENTKED